MNYKGLLLVWSLLVLEPSLLFCQTLQNKKEITINQIVPAEDSGYINVYFDLPNDPELRDKIDLFRSGLHVKEVVNGRTYDIDDAHLQVLSVDVNDGISENISSNPTSKTSSYQEKNIILVYLDRSGSMSTQMLEEVFISFKKLLRLAKATKSPLYFGTFDSYVSLPQYKLNLDGEPEEYVFTDIQPGGKEYSFAEFKNLFDKKNENETTYDTDLYGALEIGTEYLNNEDVIPALKDFTGKKVFILFTDGRFDINETKYLHKKKPLAVERHLTDGFGQEKVLNALKSIDKSIAIYPIAYGVEADQKFLTAVCDHTPNATDKVFTANVSGLNDIFNQIAKEAKSKYVIRYAPENKVFKGEKRIFKLSSVIEGQIFREDDNQKEYSYADPFNIKEFVRIWPNNDNPETHSISKFLYIVIPVCIFLLIAFAALLIYPAFYTSSFKSKYFIIYNNPSDGSETCSYCSNPFVTGDIIVNKCAHKIHAECWKDNNNSCVMYARGKCKEGKQEISGVLNLIKNPFKVDAIGNGLAGATGGIIAGLATKLFIDKILTFSFFSSFEKSAFISKSTISFGLSGLFLGFFISMSIGIFKNRFHKGFKNLIKPVLFIPVLTGIACLIINVLIFSFTQRYFNIPYLSSILIWVIFGVTVASLLALVSDMNYKNAIIGGAIGGIIGGMLVEILPLVIPPGYRSVSDIVAKMFLGGALSMVLSIVINKLEDCYLKVVSGNYNSDKPFYISKWLNRSDLGYVLIGSNGKESQVALAFDTSDQISPTHCKITKKLQAYNIENVSDNKDLLVNNRYVYRGNPAWLNNGDSIRLGKTTLRFELKRNLNNKN